MPSERFVIPDLQRIGKYDILERIADGGFATLYRGRDPFLKRLVAIKVCAAADSELRQQFLREAEIAGNLDHPSIVRTFDFGFDPVGPYLVQEYIQGEDLSQLIAERAPLAPRRKLDLLIQIAEGLAYSHSHLVLHLDIKPGNVRIIGRRQAKILDFGIARLATRDAVAPAGMVGTAGYLAPEQVMGKALDLRADVFAFGALAYELLTFCRPFTGGTIPDLLKRVLHAEAEPMTRYWPECNDALANMIGRCLRRDPAARYPSFDLLLPELVAIRDTLPLVSDGDGALPAHDAAVPARVGAASATPVESGGPVDLVPPAPPRRHRGRVRIGSKVAAAAAAATPSLAAPSASSPASPGQSLASVVAAAPDGKGVDGTAAVGASARTLDAAQAPPYAAGTTRRGSGAASSPEGTARSRGTLYAGLTAAAAVVVIALLAFLPAREPVAAAPAALDAPPSRPGGAGPGILVVTAAPWGEVTRVTDAEGAAAELPESRVTPLRLFVTPGRHEAEVRVGGSALVTCRVDVLEGGTHLCHAELSEDAASATQYFREMGWWQ